jgi:putative SOS response-associated peptidase YedK
MSPGIIPVPGLYLLGWGLVPRWWSKAPKELKQATFNARAETVAEKIFFREAFKRRRCLIPVSGYYEWQDTPNCKQPWYFTARDGSPALTTAGLWDEWRDRASGETLKSCSMIVTRAKRVCHRSARPDACATRRKGFRALAERRRRPGIAQTAANDLLQRWPVSKRVNSSKAPAEDSTLIDRIAL